MIIVKNRELLIPNNERYIGTTYDNETENRVFQVPRFSQRGVDLAALTFRLDIQYANESYDTVILDKEVGEAFIILIWKITSATLQVPGTLYIGIRAIDDEATVKWSSFSAAMYAERHLNTPGNYGGSLTEIEQIEQDHQYMKGVVDELKANIDYAHDAEAWAQGTRSGKAVPSTDKTYHKNSKYYADQANTKATAAANSATQAANSATQAAETVSDTNTRFNNAMAAVTSDTEVIDARVGADGTQYTVLKNRLDAEHNQLKNALEAGFEYIGLNLVGMDTTKLYPVYLPAGSSVTISTADGLPTPVVIRLEFYDANKTMKEWYPLQANKANRTIALSADLGDIAYLRLYNVGSQNIMVAYGSAVQPYAPYEKGYSALIETVKGHTNAISNLETLTGTVRGEEVNSWSDLPNVGTGYISPNGVVHASEYEALSDFIPVLPGDSIVYTNINCNIGGGTMMAVACYDYNKEYIANAGVSGSTSGVSGTYTFPDNVHYIRVGDYITKRGSYHFAIAMSQKDAIETLMADRDSTNLSNLKIAMIGDSTYAITGGGSASNQRINDYLADLSNAVVSNFAIGGTLMTDLRITDTWKYYDFVQLMTAKINGDMSAQLSDANLSGKPGYIRTVVTDLNAADLSTYDVLLINYGTNDYAAEAPITGDDPYAVNTLSGALRTMIERIGTAYPNLKIVLNTPYWRCWTNPSNYVNDAFTRVNGLNLKMKDYIDAINNIASGEYGLPVINNLFENGWNRYNMNIYFDSNDGTHFNVAGAKFVARKTFEFLSSQGFALGTLT